MVTQGAWVRSPGRSLEAGKSEKGKGTRIISPTASAPMQGCFRELGGFVEQLPGKITHIPEPE